MVDNINFEKFKGKIIDHIEPSTNWRETEYVGITIYFTDNTSLDVIPSGEDGYITIYD